MRRAPKHSFLCLVVVLASCATDDEREPSKNPFNQGPIVQPEGMSEQCWSLCEPYVRCLLSEGTTHSSDLMVDCDGACRQLESWGTCPVELERYLRCEGQWWANECGAVAFSADCGEGWREAAFDCIGDSTAVCTDAPGECRCTGRHPHDRSVELSCVELTGEGGGAGSGGGGGGPFVEGAVQCACKYDNGFVSLCFQDELSCSLSTSCCTFW